jgi:hypothetical protein
MAGAAVRRIEAGGGIRGSRAALTDDGAGQEAGSGG